MFNTCGKKKCSIAIATFTRGNGLIKINNIPLNLIEPRIIKTKIIDIFYVIGLKKISKINITVFVKGGGSISRIHGLIFISLAIRQALAKCILAYYTKYINNLQKDSLKILLTQYDRKLLVRDSRKVESKKFAKSGARSRYQSSYR